MFVLWISTASIAAWAAAGTRRKRSRLLTIAAPILFTLIANVSHRWVPEPYWDLGALAAWGLVTLALIELGHHFRKQRMREVLEEAEMDAQPGPMRS